MSDRSLNGIVLMAMVAALFQNHSQAQESLQHLIAPRYADMIFHNGPVLTVDDQDTVAEAVAIREGRILAVGRSDSILTLAGPDTVRIDLEGRKAVMPGVINTHSHPQRYIASHYWSEISRDHQELIRADVLFGKFQTKDEPLARLKQFAERSTLPSRPWIRVNWLVIEQELEDKNQMYVEPKSDQLFFEIKKEDLDRISPDKPMVIRRQIYNPGKPRSWALLNSQGLALFLKAYGNLLNIDLKTHSGHFSDYLYEMLYDEVLPHLPREVLVPLAKREFEEWFAPVGVTTVATRLKAYHIAAFSELDRRGEMPIRVSYGHELGRYNPFFERDIYRGLGTVVGYGTDKLWMNGISIEQPDSSPNSGLCSIYPKIKIRPGDPYPEGRCHWDVPGNKGRETAAILTRLGYRVSGTHTQGDKGYEMMLDAIIGAAGSIEEARKTRPILEHGTMANPDMIRKAAAVDAIWSTQPADIREGRHELMQELYGKEVADGMFMPTRRMLDEGITVSWESGGTDGYDNPESKRRPMVGMEIFVTRKNRAGVVQAAHHRVDRKTALRILTRGGAEYVQKEEELGSIEAGKLADLILLDRSPLDPSLPDEDLSTIQVLMTLVGGQVVYDAATYKHPSEAVRRARDGMSHIDNETE